MQAHAPDANDLIRQHLIDPEICIRCNTCEASCPVGAVTHDARNYVVDAAKCNLCMDCIPPCPTGAIDNWRMMPRASAYSVQAQLGWDVLPAELAPEQQVAASVNASAQADLAMTPPPQAAPALSGAHASFTAKNCGATVPPWSAAHAYTNLYGPKANGKYVTATVAGNVRVTEIGHEYDTHHIVLDFGATPFPVLEGQSIGILPPGVDAQGRAHHARQYSIASARNGERPGYNNLSLTIKRVLQDHEGRPVRGVASNYMCDLQVGDKVQVVGPFGASFLMPNHPKSHIVMICTGTGSAPMRAMTEWRRRLRQASAAPSPAGGATSARSAAANWGHAGDKFEGGRLMLFFGARTQQELPYFGPLQNLPKDFIDINFAFSRTPGQAKRYVQDAMRERAADLATLLADPNSYFYVCGLKSMEEGVLRALHDVAQQAGMSWDALRQDLRRQGRLHLETY
jgi:benzoyl-CoA 2,3-dioxygenase component A